MKCFYWVRGEFRGDVKGKYLWLWAAVSRALRGGVGDPCSVTLSTSRLFLSGRQRPWRVNIGESTRFRGGSAEKRHHNLLPVSMKCFSFQKYQLRVYATPEFNEILLHLHCAIFSVAHLKMMIMLNDECFFPSTCTICGCDKLSSLFALWESLPSPRKLADVLRMFGLNTAKKHSCPAVCKMLFSNNHSQPFV